MSLSLPSLRILVLGPFQVEADGLAPGRPMYDKLQGLLAYLALEPARAHARDEVARLFWPQLTAEAARANLRQALFNLKRVLGGHLPVHSDREQLRLLPERVAQVDGLDVLDPGLLTADLGRLEQSVSLFRGEFLAGLVLPDAPDFMLWRDHWRSTFFQRQLDMLETLCKGLAQQGLRDKAQAWAQVRARLAPWDEAAQQALWALPPDSAIPGPKASARRQVTLVHAALGAGADVDPELLLERLALWREDAGAQAQARGGQVCVSPGNVLLLCFGHPRAQEDAAQRAVRAALALVDAPNPWGLTLRVGVHTAWVVTGSNPATPDLLGHATQAVARVAEQAPPGAALLSATTRQMVAACFDDAEHPAPSGVVPGVDGPLYRVLGDRGVRVSWDAPQTVRTPLVGRQRELSRLATWGSEALHQGLRVVVVRGDAGMGKSRLVRAFAEQLKRLSWVVCELFCRAEAQHTPLHPVVAHWGGAATLAAAGADKNDGFDGVMTLLGQGVEGAHTLSESQRKQAMAALAHRLLAAAGSQPTVLLVEDMHWADPSTQALLAQVVRQPPVSPLLVVLTLRSPHALPEGLATDTHLLDLPPLDPDATTALVRQAVPELPAQALSTVVTRAEGIPLFAEALAQSLVQAAHPGGELPGSLQDLLTAQLEATDAMAVAQGAAAIGREFDLALLRRVVDTDETVLVRGLHALQQARLIEPCRASAGAVRYGFRHALIQQAARAAQTRSERCAVHRRVAQALGVHFAQQAQEGPEELARHYTEADMPDQAMTWWLAAGVKAMRSAAYAEAVAHLRSGVSLLDRLPEGPERRAHELSLRLPLGPSLVALMGYGSPEAIATFDRVAELCPADDPRRFAVLWGLWLVWSSRPDSSFAAADAWAHEMLTIAERSGDPVQLTYAHAAWANDAVWQGHLDRAEHHIQHTLRHARSLALTDCNLGGHDPRVAVLGQRAWVRMAQGQTKAALQAGGRACALARTLNHPESLCFAITHLAVVHRLMGNAALVARAASDVSGLATRHGLPLWQAVAAMQAGWAQAMAGQAEGLAWLQGSAAAVRQAMPSALGAFLHPLAEAQAQLADWPGVLQTTEEGLAMALRVGDGFHLPDLYRLRAQALAHLGPAEEARKCMRLAMQHGASQGAALWQQRAQALSMAWR
jgi:DNA-binding SARP family transcriptional activator